MRLRDLDAQFYKLIPPDADGRTQYAPVEVLAQADGVMFQCPKCAAEHGGKVEEEEGRRFVRGAHMVLCWFKGKVPDSIDPKPGRWNPSGSGLDDLTFVPPGAVSVFLTAGCGWHGFVVNGDAT